MKKLETWTLGSGNSITWYLTEGSRKMKIEIVRAKKGWFFRIMASNGRTLCHSECYVRKAGCIKSAKLFNIPIVEVAI